MDIGSGIIERFHQRKFSQIFSKKEGEKIYPERRLEMKKFFDQVDIFLDKHEIAILIILMLIAIIGWLYWAYRNAPLLVECQDCGYPDKLEKMQFKEGCDGILVCGFCARK
jgi:hypothetical protein